jgi:hypothetical protein
VVRHANFGIWRLWEELTAEFPETFTFHHSWGLGVLRKPGSPSKAPAFLDQLFASGEEGRERIRRHYVLYTSHLDRLLVNQADASSQPEPSVGKGATPEAEETFFQVFLPESDNYSEAASLREELAIGEWKSLRFDLPSGVSGAIRLDPSDRPCVLQINSIRLVDANSGTPVWSAQTDSQLKALELRQSALFLPQSETCLILSYGSDPQIFLPRLRHSSGLSLEVSVRLHPDFRCLVDALLPQPSGPSEQALAEQAKLLADVEMLKGELRASQSFRLLLAAELSQTAMEKTSLAREKDEELRRVQDRLKELQGLWESSSTEQNDTARAIALESEKSLTALRLAVENSMSWRVTKPLRSVMQVIRGRRSGASGGPFAG